VGCEQQVRQQIDYVVERGPIGQSPKRVLVIGASTGYGLAARITSAFACGADTLGVCFEHPGGINKPGSAGWYNTAAFQRFAAEQGRYARDIIGDAFSSAVKQRAIELIKQDLGQVDLVIYSLAAPRRKHPLTGVVYTSALKPIGKSVALRTIDTDKEIIKEVVLPPATQSEIEHTVAVMGGQDWQMWIEALLEAGVLAEGSKTTAFTYVGKQITQDIYWNGSIGAAKKDLDQTCRALRERLSDLRGDARVSVLKAVVTHASSAIPTMPLYLSLLFEVMKSRGSHEGCIEQIYRLYQESLYGNSPRLDAEGRLRADDSELDDAVQTRIQDLWPQISTENFRELADFDGYKSDFLRLFGFGMPNVDYDAEVNPEVSIPHLVQL